MGAGLFVLKLSLGICRLGAFAWDFLLGNFLLGYFASDPSFWDPWLVVAVGTARRRCRPNRARARLDKYAQGKSMNELINVEVFEGGSL